MSKNIYDYLDRTNSLFQDDLLNHEREIFQIINRSKFLVLGGAGTIGQALVKEIFKREPLKLHIVDISENNLVELVRDLRSSMGYIKGDFKTFALDLGSLEYDQFFNSDGDYDYVLNLSAIKHVRSEKDPYTLMRMIRVNILNTEKTIEQSIRKGVKKYFCVSTDKATNPVNLMGATKRVMELFMMEKSQYISVSSARFANVLFSDGSLLHSFGQRIQKNQPIVAPIDIKRYFVTPEESGQLCLFSALLGENRDVFFPRLNERIHQQSFDKLAYKFLKKNGLKPYLCNSEEEAREIAQNNNLKNQWPCYFSKSDTSGEKPFEEFYKEDEILDLNSYKAFGIIKNKLFFNKEKLDHFKIEITNLINLKKWSRNDLVNIIRETIPEFKHFETGRFLDDKM